MPPMRTGPTLLLFLTMGRAMKLEEQPIGTELIWADGRVRIWLLELEPGEETAVHQHRCDYIYIVLSPGETVTINQDGTKQFAVDDFGDAVFHPVGQPHSLKNLGSTKYSNIIVELLATEIRTDER
jgi:mannose-6-phosphate isomerase-like protein (cupin superfamily)